MPARVPASKKMMYTCVGGPWDGYKVRLQDETAIFTIKEFTGKYVYGVWKCTPSPSATQE